MKNDNYKIVITSEHKWLNLHLGEVIRYKDLILFFVKRDFITRYKQTVIGPLWAIIQPLMTTIVFTVIFGVVAALPTTDVSGDFKIPAFLFFMSGNILWGLFSSVLNACSNIFINNQGIMGKVYFPRLISPIASTLSHFITFLIQFAIFVFLVIVFILKGDADATLTPRLVFIPFILLQTLILSFGCGIILASVTTKYRDLKMLVGFGLHLWQYATPIAYGLCLVSERIPKYTWLYLLNPVTPIITTFRYCFFGFGFFDLTYYLISWSITIVIFFISLLLFGKIERSFIDCV